MKNHLPITLEQLEENIKLLGELDTDEYPEIIRYPESGGWVAIQKEAHRVDLKKNLAIAEVLARYGYAVEIRKHIKDSRILAELDIKNPEYTGGVHR